MPEHGSISQQSSIVIEAPPCRPALLKTTVDGSSSALAALLGYRRALWRYTYRWHLGLDSGPSDSVHKRSTAGSPITQGPPDPPWGPQALAKRPLAQSWLATEHKTILMKGNGQNPPLPVARSHPVASPSTAASRWEAPRGTYRKEPWRLQSLPSAWLLWRHFP